MSKKKLTNKKNMIMYSISALCAVIGLFLTIFGIVKLMNLDLDYEKEKIACDDKDYSSYVKYTETSTPGNADINSQLDIVKRAMGLASDANDAVAYGKLLDQYNQLLQMQAQTSTKSGKYDYSEANAAKDRCYSLADKQKDSNRVSGIVLASTGGALIVFGATLGLLYAYNNNKKKQKAKKHSAGQKTRLKS